MIPSLSPSSRRRRAIDLAFSFTRPPARDGKAVCAADSVQARQVMGTDGVLQASCPRKQTDLSIKSGFARDLAVQLPDSDLLRIKSVRLSAGFSLLSRQSEIPRFCVRIS